MEQHASIWQQTAQIDPRPPLPGDLRTDAVILGGGMAGLLTAHQLQQRGMRAVVLEAGRIAGGQTGHTTAKITSQHGICYDALIQKFGINKAGQYARANELAIREYARIIRNGGIDCDFHETFACVYSTVSEAPMHREAEAAASLGIPARFTAETELPFPVAGAVRFDRQARFHPLKFLQSICRSLEIYENTRALSVEGEEVRTPQGIVRAKHIVFATHFPFVNFPGWYFLRMHQERSYVLALESDWLPEGMYLGADADGLSFREACGRLLMGGGSHRTGENSAGGRYDQLLSRARELLPASREAGRWSAQDCITLDGVPYIGPFSPSAPGWYVATGFGKWGMTGSMVAAMLISEQICGHIPDWAEIFLPSRFSLSASARELATDTAQAFKGLSKELFSISEDSLADLPRGHGGIVAVDGHKAGVYKDVDGICHIVAPRCPHLGCELEWNPDELSWDCPCHGSRFRYDGSLIDNPAQANLQRPEASDSRP